MSSQPTADQDEAEPEAVLSLQETPAVETRSSEVQAHISGLSVAVCGANQ
ncbi:hypothetical protein [Streptacidiphilus anmyonensis]|nr:hypothetical protein [Streptacidiphilus anmyonensis]